MRVLRCLHLKIGFVSFLRNAAEVVTLSRSALSEAEQVQDQALVLYTQYYHTYIQNSCSQVPLARDCLYVSNPQGLELLI